MKHKPKTRECPCCYKEIPCGVRECEYCNVASGEGPVRYIGRSAKGKKPVDIENSFFALAIKIREDLGLI